jgi:NAD(P)-dependent dehydrogenase (short-subunit alcohol dehydrogenase family)
VSTILITGAGRGLGLELARQYAAAGWRVVGTVRSAEAKLPAGVDKHLADVTDLRAVHALAEALRGQPIDVLFCNAGINGKRGMALGSFDYPSWEAVFRVNVLGAAAIAEALLDNVLASERKVIAMMSSRLGSITEASGVTLPYGTSKAALNMLVKGLAATLAPKGAIVVALSPGWARTDMGGAGAPLAPEASVAGLRQVIAGLRREDSGKFLSYDGSPIPW